MNVFKKCISLFTISLALSGCSSNMIEPADVEKSAFIANKIDNKHFLHKNLEVETNGFFFISDEILTKKSRANLDNDDARKALELSLDSANMLSSDADFTLRATLLDAGLEEKIGFRFINNREINITINYILFNNLGHIIYDKDITSSGYISDYSLFNLNAYEKEKDAVERAYKENFKELTYDLKVIEDILMPYVNYR